MPPGRDVYRTRDRNARTYIIGGSYQLSTRSCACGRDRYCTDNRTTIIVHVVAVATAKSPGQ
jgi:hypothetical protein